MDKPKYSINQERLLYNRKKNVDIFLLPSRRHLRAVAEMQDSVHHMRIIMIVNYPSLRIKQIECQMPGVPDSMCRNALQCLKSLIGKRVMPGLTREMKEEARQGCAQLINLFHEVCYNLIQAQRVLAKERLTRSFPRITEEQMIKLWMLFAPEMQNSCVRYAENSPFMQKVRAVEMPRGTEKLKAVAPKKPRDTKLAN